MPTDEEIGRVRGYLQSRSAALSPDELIQTVTDSFQALIAAANAVPSDRLSTPPTGEEWTPLDCLRHCAAYNMRVAQQILFAAIEGVLPDATEPELPANREEVINQYGAALESLYEHVRFAQPDANLDVKWAHEWFGELNWREWLLFLRVHMNDHTPQIRHLGGVDA